MSFKGFLVLRYWPNRAQLYTKVATFIKTLRRRGGIGRPVTQPNIPFKSKVLFLAQADRRSLVRRHRRYQSNERVIVQAQRPLKKFSAIESHVTISYVIFITFKALIKRVNPSVERKTHKTSPLKETSSCSSVRRCVAQC